jgi:uncharacterized membrane protein
VRRATLIERLALAAILIVAFGLRLWLLLGPFSEIDADEAVVGLMAMQMPGELPAFYWEQHYLGTIEPMTAALVFAVMGPSAAALKLVPALYSVAFIGVLYMVARRICGPGVAQMSAMYLAVPPSFFAAWNVKARGGYPEALLLGAVCLLAAQRVSKRPADRNLATWRWWITLGLASGLALWTHPMSVVLVAAAGLYLLLMVRPWSARWTRGPRLAAPVWLAAVAFMAGLSPAIIHNLANDLPSLRFAAEGGTEPRAALLNLWGLTRYGLPVLVGLAEGTPSRELLVQDWPTRIGSSWLVTVTLPLLGLYLIWWHRRSLVALVRGDETEDRQPALLLLVLLLVPPFVAVSRFANLWAEPRYALPIYAAVPLVMSVVWAVRRRWRWLGSLLLACLLGLNVASLESSDYRLSLPTSAGGSTAANRAELIAALQARGIDRMYTDYWLAYPIAFESREQIVPSVWSGGFGRRAVYSHLVYVSHTPAFVFARGTSGDAEFQTRMAEFGGRAASFDVSIYRVYTQVEPLDLMRKP